MTTEEIKNLKKEVDALQIEVMKKNRFPWSTIVATFALLVSVYTTYTNIQRSIRYENRSQVKEVIQLISNLPIEYADLLDQHKDNPYLLEGLLKKYYLLATLGKQLHQKCPGSFQTIEPLFIAETLSNLQMYDDNFVDICNSSIKSDIPFVRSYANRILGKYYFTEKKDIESGRAHFQEALNILDQSRSNIGFSNTQKIYTYMDWAFMESFIDNTTLALDKLNHAKDAASNIPEKYSRKYLNMLNAIEIKLSKKLHQD